jgi:hypothetical protein
MRVPSDPERISDRIAGAGSVVSVRSSLINKIRSDRRDASLEMGGSGLGCAPQPEQQQIAGPVPADERSKAGDQFNLGIAPYKATIDAETAAVTAGRLFCCCGSDISRKYQDQPDPASETQAVSRTGP